MKYLKLYEESNSVNKINWEMIEDIKDMALEYLDYGFILYIHIYSEELVPKDKRFKNPVLVPMYHGIYKIKHSHSDTVGHWRYKKGFKDHWSHLDEFGPICYLIMLYAPGENYAYRHHLEESKELISRIEEAYPNEDILSHIPSNIASNYVN